MKHADPDDYPETITNYAWPSRHIARLASSLRDPVWIMRCPMFKARIASHLRTGMGLNGNF